MNRTTKILLAALVALVPVYVAASWWCGKLARNAFDEIERSVSAESSDVFRIVERESTQGLFSSTEVFTIEIGRAREAHARAQSDEVSFRRVANEETGVPGEEEEIDLTDGDEDAPAPAARKPERFVVHSDIRHGPFPGFTSFGVARVKSRLVFDDAVRTEIAKVIGDREPVTLVTQVGFSGGASLHLASPAFKYEAEGSTVSWQGIEGRVDVGRNARSIDCDVRMPGLSSEGAEKNFSMGALSLTCDMERAFDELYTGDMAFRIESMQSLEDNKPFSLGDAHYAARIAASGDYMDIGLKLGVGAIQAPQFAFNQLQYDFTLNHLHGPTLAALSRDVKAVQHDAAEAGAAPNPSALTAAIMQHWPALLEHDPVLVVDHIGLKSGDAEFSLKAEAKLVGFTAADLEAGPQVLLAKLEATADVALDEAMAMQFAAMRSGEAAPGAPQVDRSAAMQQQLQAMEQQGYLKRNGDTFESHIEWRGGALTVNGKPLR